MPSKSGAQHRFMEVMAHSPDEATEHGIKPSVAKEFVDADKGRKFGPKRNPLMDADAPRKPKGKNKLMGHIDYEGP